MEHGCFYCGDDIVGRPDRVKVAINGNKITVAAHKLCLYEYVDKNGAT